MQGVWLVCIAVFCLAACSKSPEERRIEHMERGNAYFSSQEFKKAVIEYRNVVQADPKFAPGHYKLAQAYLKSAQRFE